MDTPIPLIATKLYIPPRRSEHISRPRLFELLSKGLSTKLTLISAPAGFGKTTMVSDWIHQQDVPAGWFSVDEDDNDPVQFLAYFLSALQQVFPEMNTAALYVLQSPGSPSMESLLSILAKDMSSIQREFLLVLDDFHLITNDWIRKFIQEILEHLPHQMHLILITRSDPALLLARLRSQNQLTEVRASELAFTVEEMAAFFNKTLHLSLPPSDISLLQTRTEGWIAGLQLAALSMQDAPDISQYINEITADHRYIADYLLEEVLSRQSEEDRRFLLYTSILNRLSGPLCNTVTGQEDGSEMLNRLEKKDLFLFPLDNKRQWFRYHRLFADLLQQRLASEAEDLIPELHQRASRWHEMHGELSEAIEHALEAGQHERAANLIEQVAEETVKHSHFATFLRWTDSLPDATIETRPGLCVFHAMAMLYSGQPLVEAEAHIARLEAATSKGTGAGELAAFRALVTTLQGKGEEGIPFAEEALRLLPENNLFLRSIIAGIRGLAYLYAGRLRAAIPALQEAVDISRRAGNRMNTVLALCHLAELAILAGELLQAKTLYEKALDAGTVNTGYRLPVAGLALAGLGAVYLERYELELAVQYLTEGLELTRHWARIGTLRDYLNMAKLHQVQGRLKEAESMLEKARRVALDFDATQMDDHLVDLAEIRLWISQNRLTEAERKFGGHRFGPSKQGSATGGRSGSNLWEQYLLQVEQILRARLALRQGRPETTIDLLEPWIESVDPDLQAWFLIEMLIVISLAYQAGGQSALAMNSLGRALSLAQPGGFITVFISEGDPVIDLLHRIDEHQAILEEYGVSHAYVKNLLLTSKAMPVGRAERETRPDSLSDRELEVLHLLAAGLTNNEIAEKLFISLNTVRSHTKNIYGKLNVHSRTKAAARGKELGLI